MGIIFLKWKKSLNVLDSDGFEGLVAQMTSVLPIVQTCRRAFVCASDYDDRTQFKCSNKKQTWIKNYIQRNRAGLMVVLLVRKSEKQSIFTFLLPHQRGNTAGLL